MRPTISGPDLRYQARTYNIRPRRTISGPQTKQRFRSCSKRFSPRTASKIHEHFDQQNGTKLFFPQLCFIPFTICQVSSKIVKQQRSTSSLRRSYSWSRWIMSNSRRSTVLCFIASKNKRFGNYLIIIIFITYIPPFHAMFEWTCSKLLDNPNHSLPSNS